MPDHSNENISYRNVNAVHMKLANFRALDPQYTVTGKVGLTKGGKTDAEVWNDFSNNPNNLHIIATAISKASSQSNSFHDHRPPASIHCAIEGEILTRMHTVRERDRGLAQKKKFAIIEATGKLACEGCKLDYLEKYGDSASEVMEVHHLLPLHALPGARQTRISELALLCANCHRLVHSRKPWLNMKDLSTLVSTENG